MSAHDPKLAKELVVGLKTFAKKRGLPGISNPNYREAFIQQLIESIHRVKFVHLIRARQISERRGDPNDELFDPLRTAILQQRRNNLEEAFWLVFLFVQFGKSPRGGWRYVREIYGKLNEGGRWDWASTSRNPKQFRNWLHLHRAQLERPGGGFGNHRKYESLNAYSKTGTGETVETYVNWIASFRSHQAMIATTLATVSGQPLRAFDVLYRSMSVVRRFGRTARFDYLTMLGKLGLADIEPGSTYMQGATGPVRGARLLFGDAGNQQLDAWLLELNSVLHVGMQVLEDSLCNWQKSPGKFKPFRG